MTTFKDSLVQIKPPIVHNSWELFRQGIAPYIKDAAEEFFLEQLYFRAFSAGIELGRAIVMHPDYKEILKDLDAEHAFFGEYVMRIGEISGSAPCYPKNFKEVRLD